MSEETEYKQYVNGMNVNGDNGMDVNDNDEFKTEDQIPNISPNNISSLYLPEPMETGMLTPRGAYMERNNSPPPILRRPLSRPSLTRSNAMTGIGFRNKSDLKTSDIRLSLKITEALISGLCDTKDDGTIKVNIDPSLYTCCVCREPLVKNAGYCSHKHCTCTDCYKKMTKHSNTPSCPMCRDKIYVKCQTITDIVRHTRISCKNSENGCSKLLFPQEMNEHFSDCTYRTCKCLFCDTQTNPKDLTAHLITECQMEFKTHNLTTGIDYITSQNVKNIIIEAENGMIIIIIKTNDMCKIACINPNLTGDQNSDVIKLQYSERNYMFSAIPCGSKIKRSSIIDLPIHTPQNIVSNTINYFNIKLSDLEKYYDLKLPYINDAFQVSEKKWEILNPEGVWVTGIIVERDYTLDSIMVKYDEGMSGNNREWIRLRTDIHRIRHYMP